jgi:hypothetical protein
MSSPVILLAGHRAVAAGLPRVETYRDPGCGCCEMWVEHLRQAGFEVTIIDDPDRPARRAALGIADDYASCHTALIGPYALEGHVPMRDVLRLLDERPDSAIGLSVPGMPMGSPGMEAGDQREAFEVLLLSKERPPQVYARYPA